MARIRCFIIERTWMSRWVLRRYSEGRGGEACGGYHDGRSDVIAETQDDLSKPYMCMNPPERPPSDDQRWPQKCGKCDYKFSDADHFQVFGDPIYKRQDTGEILSRKAAPAGALWRAHWYEEDDGAVKPGWTGSDGQSWECMLPGGHIWFIDGGCSNCTRKGEPHHCWVREGVAPDFNVGKGGNTCAAGAGSIAVPGYHGFLRHGYLED
jgi:hypothetical protein